MRWLLVAVLVVTVPPKAKPPLVVIQEITRSDQIVCAEYTSRGAERKTSRSCVEASVVREWILRGGKPTEECGP